MTTYEILLLLDPEQAESRQDEIVARTRELVEKGGGTWQSHDLWGRRRLAYPIAHKEEGVYHLVVFEAPAETLDEISRVLKIDDAVVRHMATRHIAGSRTSAPRDEGASAVAGSSAGGAGEARPEDPGAPSPTAVSDDGEPEYAGAEEQPDEEPAAAGSADEPGEEEE